jgi:hypothetical protein
MSRPRLTRGLGTGSYDVSLDGQLIGRVHKRATHYNLRRPVTVHYWTAETATRERLFSPGSRSGFRTRADAIVALVEAAS